MNKDTDEWRRCPYPMVRYEVNRNGDVRHIRRKEILKPRKSDTNYRYRVVIEHQGKRKAMHIYKLVAMAFVDGYEPSKVINHINGNQLDNRASNLEWVTPSENVRHEMLLNSRPIIIYADDGTSRCFLCKKEAERFGYLKYLKRKGGKQWKYISHWDFWLSHTLFYDALISDMMIDTFNKYYKFFLEHNLFRPK